MSATTTMVARDLGVVELNRYLSFDIRLKTCVWDGEPRVDIRKYVNDDKPTIKGVSLSCKRWNKLMVYQEKITSAFHDLNSEKIDDGTVMIKEHIGGGVCISMTAPYAILDIRKTFRNQKGERCYTQKGVGLKADAWKALLMCQDALLMAIPTLHINGYCSHENQEAAFECIECCD